MYRQGNSSPTGSVQSMRVFMDTESCDGYYIDSDAASTTSSLIDFNVDLESEDVEETMVGGQTFASIFGNLLDLSQQQHQT